MDKARGSPLNLIYIYIHIQILVVTTSFENGLLQPGRRTLAVARVRWGHGLARNSALGRPLRRGRAVLFGTRRARLAPRRVRVVLVARRPARRRRRHRRAGHRYLYARRAANNSRRRYRCARRDVLSTKKNLSEREKTQKSHRRDDRTTFSRSARNDSSTSGKYNDIVGYFLFFCSRVPGQRWKLFKVSLLRSASVLLYVIRFSSKTSAEFWETCPRVVIQGMVVFGWYSLQRPQKSNGKPIILHRNTHYANYEIDFNY